MAPSRALARAARTVGLAMAVGAGGVPAAVVPPASFGDGVCALRAAPCPPAPRLAVLAAMPSELEPLLERATVAETLVVGDRVLRVGTLEGMPVVLGILGIGMVHAADTTNLVLDRFDVEAVIVSGVAGAPYRIGDVTVPAVWLDDACVPFAADPGLLSAAGAVAAAPPAFEHCTPVPPEPPGGVVCLAHQPTVIVGGTGLSSDPFGGTAPACRPQDDPIFGCDVEPRRAARAACPVGFGNFEDTGAEDMETGAVAREATRRGVPFVALRALSDGDGDPLGLPGFPAQFFAYYRLAARNAATATAALVAAWAGRPGGAAPASRAAPAETAVAARASCGWERRATAGCEAGAAPRTLDRRVGRACGLLGAAATGDPSSTGATASAPTPSTDGRASTPDAPTADVRASRPAAAARRAWCRAARSAGRGAVRRRLGAGCAAALVEAMGRGCR